MSFLWRAVTLNKQNNSKEKPSSTKNSSNYSLTLDCIPIMHSIKGISLFIVLPAKNKLCKATMTVEAAVVLPLLLVFFMNLLSAIEMIRLHGNLQLALWETGNQMAIYSYAYQNMTEDLIDNLDDSEESISFQNSVMGVVFTNVYARNRVMDYVGKEYLDESPLTYGADGLNFLESTYMEEDCIDLIVTYEVSPRKSLSGLPRFRMANRYYGRAWTGYAIPITNDEQETDYVYITKYGYVYHVSEECSHLKRSVETVSPAEVLFIKNESGQYYTPCWVCEEIQPEGKVYITADGTRYHFNKECAAIKRIKYTIKKSEAEQYKACNRCGK